MHVIYIYLLWICTPIKLQATNWSIFGSNAADNCQRMGSYLMRKLDEISGNSGDPANKISGLPHHLVFLMNNQVSCMHWVYRLYWFESYYVCTMHITVLLWGTRVTPKTTSCWRVQIPSAGSCFRGDSSFSEQHYHVQT